MAANTPPALVIWFERHFSVRLPFPRFALNTILLSLTGLAPVLALYIAMTPGFGAHLATADSALARFLRQIVTNGVPTVFTVNAVSMMLFAHLRSRSVDAKAALALDFAARTVLFAALHALVFFASASLFGSFGGDPKQALRVVGPTLGQAAGFGNLSGVYLYATLVSALPLHMALAGIWLQARGYQAVSGAVLVFIALAVIAAQILLLTAFARALSLFA